DVLPRAGGGGRPPGTGWRPARERPLPAPSPPRPQTPHPPRSPAEVARTVSSGPSETPPGDRMCYLAQGVVGVRRVPSAAQPPSAQHPTQRAQHTPARAAPHQLAREVAHTVTSGAAEAPPGDRMCYLGGKGVGRGGRGAAVGPPSSATGRSVR